MDFLSNLHQNIFTTFCFAFALEEVLSATYNLIYTALNLHRNEDHNSTRRLRLSVAVCELNRAI